MRVAVRIPLIVVVAALVNLVMFSAMQYMVGNRQLRLADTAEFDLANFIRMTEQSRPVKSRREPKAPEKPAAEEQQQLQRLAQAPTGGALGGLSVTLPEFDLDIGANVGSNIQIARELTPLVRTPPEYPMRALVREIEGYVILRFTVTETGSVADPEVLRSDPPGMFDSAALRTVLKWKYRPQTSGGQPVSVITTARIRYEMEKK